MLKNIKPKLTATLIIALIITGSVYYVQYLVNKPTEILKNYTIPTEFIYNNTKIALDWTDDNEGETLIIQSDRKEYNGFNSVDVYFSITNISKKDQNMDVVVWVGDEKVKVKDIKTLDKDDSNFQFSISNFKTISNDLMNKFSDRKNINGFTTGYSANDDIESGNTNYYKTTIKYPPMSNGEFFIEAFGAEESKEAKLPIGSLASLDSSATYGHLDPWYSSNWLYRKRIDIEADQIATTTANFPILATTTDSDLAFTGHSGKVASSTGADIVFADAEGNLLNYEREKYASTTGEIVYWIKTDISSTTDKTIYMYYGNSGASDLATTTGVWDDNFVMVQHLAHDGVATTTYPDFLDSTENNNDGSSVAMNSDDLVDGRFDGSLDFDGSGDYVSVGINAADVTEGTISLWWQPNFNSNSNAGTAYLFTGNNSSPNDGLYLRYKASDGGAEHDFRFQLNVNYSASLLLRTIDNTAPCVFSAGDWVHVVALWNSTGFADLYIDGVIPGYDDKTEDSYTPGNYNETSYYVGGSESENAKGIIDEVRISNIARTAGWISTEYNNQSDVGSFLTFGAEEDNVPTEFVSTVMQSGGDYGGLSAWEDAVECDLTATTTRVFSGTGTGQLSENNPVELFREGVDTGIDGVVVATTSSQILVDGITGVYDDGLVVQSGDQWRYLDSESNSFTVSGIGAQLGNSTIAIAKIDGAWSSADETAVTIDGWTTSASNYIKVYTTDSARHEGKWDEVKYRLEITNNACLLNDEDYVRIDGLQINTIATTGSSNHGVLNDADSASGSEVIISYNIIKAEHSGTAVISYGILSSPDVSDDNSVVKIYNNIVFDFNLDLTYDAGIRTSHGKSIIYNNTVYNCCKGIDSGSGADTEIIKNNISYCDAINSDFTDYQYISGGTYGNNLSSDTTSPDNDYDNQTVIFEDESNDDFHLAMGDTVARNQGTNLSKDSNLSFQDDIDGISRDASWDIGADEAENVWYNQAYQCRRTITLQSSQIATTTSNFPVLATTTFTNLKTSTNGGIVQNNSGHDIVFINSNGSSLMNYEREKYASTTGEIVYWIKTDISSTTDKTIYMYYGNSGASDLATTTGVWDDNFVGVWHMNNAGMASTTDSTKQDNDGSTIGPLTATTSEQIDGALWFDGTDDYISIGNAYNGVKTISFWLKPDDITDRMILDIDGTDYIQINANSKIEPISFPTATIYIDGIIASSTDTDWHYTVITDTTGVNASAMDIGRVSTNYFDGIIDEVRISNTVHTAGWISTEYNNQSDVDSFIIYGTEECLSVPVERSGGESVKTRIKGGSVFKGGVRF